MHIQEILNAINTNHTYEYFVVDGNLQIIEYSDKAFQLCAIDDVECDNLDLLQIVPELYGMEAEIEKIFKKNREILTLPHIIKNSDQYVHIHIYPGRENKEEKNHYETLIVLFENITTQANIQQKLIQERNEKSLLLKEISKKNIQLKRFNEEMQVMVEAEINKNREKQKIMEIQSRHAQIGEMIGMITHQWKQPLSVINLIMNVLKIKLKKDPIEIDIFDERLNRVLMQVKYLDQTVVDFQNFFNPMKERISFNLFENIKSVLKLIESEYQYKHINIKVEGDENISAYGYPNEFIQILLSLLKNSKDAFEENPHDNMQITIDISRDNGNACIHVKDNAGGIPENMIDKLFDLYITSKKKGSGLGLNIAKNMVENMHGTLNVQNFEDGAEFSIFLPSNQEHRLRSDQTM